MAVVREICRGGAAKYNVKELSSRPCNCPVDLEVLIPDSTAFIRIL